MNEGYNQGFDEAAPGKSQGWQVRIREVDHLSREPLCPEDIEEFAREWIGTPKRHDP